MGDNTYGQLGIGFLPTMTNIPQQVIASGVTAIAAGNQQSLFRMGGSLWVMGKGADGELGDGTTNNHFFPEKIFSATAGISLSMIGNGPSDHTLFSTSGIIAGANALRGMGDNQFGELGDGSLTNHVTPEEIVPGGINSIAVGSGFSLFVESDGSLWGMGRNNVGQLGTGNLTSTNRPERIVPLGVASVAAGGGHTLFIKTDGSLWVMGDNVYGQLGDNSLATPQDTPIQILFNGAIAAAAGEIFSLYLKSDGSLWGMGTDGNGQIGTGVATNYYLAVQIVASNVVAIAAGDSHSVFIKSDGSLWGMGTGFYGQLGNNGTADHLTPILIVPGVPPAPDITSTSIAGSNLNLHGTNGVTGEILYTLMSTDLSQPLGQWTPVATNVLSTTGNFSITATNAVDPNAAQRFYVLLAQ